jgi:hypothetical protein
MKNCEIHYGFQRGAQFFASGAKLSHCRLASTCKLRSHHCRTIDAGRGLPYCRDMDEAVYERLRSFLRSLATALPVQYQRSICTVYDAVGAVHVELAEDLLAFLREQSEAPRQLVQLIRDIIDTPPGPSAIGMPLANEDIRAVAEEEGVDLNALSDETLRWIMMLFCVKVHRETIFALACFLVPDALEAMLDREFAPLARDGLVIPPRRMTYRNRSYTILCRCAVRPLPSLDDRIDIRDCVHGRCDTDTASWQSWIFVAASNRWEVTGQAAVYDTHEEKRPPGLDNIIFCNSCAAITLQWPVALHRREELRARRKTSMPTYSIVSSVENCDDCVRFIGPVRFGDCRLELLCSCNVVAVCESLADRVRPDTVAHFRCLSHCATGRRFASSYIIHDESGVVSLVVDVHGVAGSPVRTTRYKQTKGYVTLRENKYSNDVRCRVCGGESRVLPVGLYRPRRT